jgi:hypothetical protein
MLSGFGSKSVGKECKGVSFSIHTKRKTISICQSNGTSCNLAHWTLSSYRILLVVLCMYSQEQTNHQLIPVLQVQNSACVPMFQYSQYKSKFSITLPPQYEEKIIFKKCVVHLIIIISCLFQESINCFRKDNVLVVKNDTMQFGDVFSSTYIL